MSITINSADGITITTKERDRIAKLRRIARGKLSDLFFEWNYREKDTRTTPNYSELERRIMNEWIEAEPRAVELMLDARWTISVLATDYLLRLGEQKWSKNNE